MKKFLVLVLCCTGCSNVSSSLVQSATICVEKNELYQMPVVKLEIKIK